MENLFIGMLVGVVRHRNVGNYIKEGGGGGGGGREREALTSFASRLEFTLSTTPLNTSWPVL